MLSAIMTLCEEVNEIRRSLREPRHVCPIIRRAIIAIGYKQVRALADYAIGAYGFHYVHKRLRTPGGIFLKALKKHPKRSEIFLKKPPAVLQEQDEIMNEINSAIESTL